MARSVRIHRAPPNTNLIAPRGQVPQLFTELPDVTALDDLIQHKGGDVTVRACGAK